MLKAPADTSLAPGDWVRVAFDSEVEGVEGQVWQYGKIGYVYNKQLVDITFDGSAEKERDCDHIPTYDVHAVA